MDRKTAALFFLTVFVAVVCLEFILQMFLGNVYLHNQILVDGLAGGMGAFFGLGVLKKYRKK